MSSRDHIEEDTAILSTALEKLRSRLLDQTRRNRLLNYKESARDVTIIDEVPDQVYEHLIQEKKPFDFLPYEPEDQGTEEDSEPPNRTLPNPGNRAAQLPDRHTDQFLQTPFPRKELARRLKKLYREHRTIIEETGANNLYLATGFLQWTEQRDDSPVYSRAPLMLLPVRLTRERRVDGEAFTLIFDDEALDTNFSLAERLSHDFGISLPELQEDSKPNDYWAQVDRAISRRRVDGWEVMREMSLGLFRFNKQVMWHDLDPRRWPAHSPLFDKQVLQRILLGPSPGDSPPGQLIDEFYQDDPTSEGRQPLRLIKDADSSQYTALIDALEQPDGLVIEGPPGTGKSQTITNLISVALDQGLSILFVAEKMAALEVVHKRLREAELDQYCLQLHGLKTNKKELLESLAKRMSHRATTPGQLELREESLRQARSEMIEVSQALQKSVGPENLPLYEIVWRVERLLHALPDGFEAPAFKQPAQLDYSAFEHARNILKDLGREWAAIPMPARLAWGGFLPEKYADSQEKQVINSLSEITAAAHEARDWLLGQEVEPPADLHRVVRLLNLGMHARKAVLPALPPGAESRVIYRIARDHSLDIYRDFVNRIQRYLDVVGEVNAVFDYASSDAETYADNLALHCGRLSNSICLPNTRIHDLNDEYALFVSVINDLTKITEYAAPAQKYRKGYLRTLSDCEQLVEFSGTLAFGPAELSLHGSPVHTKVSVVNHLRAAAGLGSELEEAAKALQTYFHVERVRDAGDLQELAETVSLQAFAWFPLIHSDYRAAKRKIRRLLREPSQYSRKPDFIERLESLVTYCLRKEQFAADKDLQSTLGTLFQGVKTDWSALNTLVEFSQKLREQLGGEHARDILSDWDAHCEQMTAVSERLGDVLAQAKSFAESHPFPKPIWKRPIVEIIGVLKPWVEKLVLAKQSIVEPWVGVETTLTEALSAVENFQLAREKESEIESHQAFTDLLGPVWEKSSTNLAKLQSMLEWMDGRLKTPGVDLALIEWLFENETKLRRDRFSNLVSVALQFKNSVGANVAFLGSIGIVSLQDWIGGRNSKLDEFANKTANCANTVGSLLLMQRWQAINREAGGLGLKEFSHLITAGILDETNAHEAFEYAIYSQLLESAMRDNQVLEGFAHTRYENLRSRFSELDKESLGLNARTIAAKLNQNHAPPGISHGRVGQFTDLGLIRNELRKKSRHIKVRQLVTRSKNALQALKPCFLMSPLSVAQYLPPGEIEFDLVVMDEASQLRPEDALGAIARSRKAVIVGDPKQLPPTSFFDTAIAEDDDAEETIVDDTESILDVCLKQFPFRRLRWHYRSQHESLIQFSNDQFYDGDLIVFPSPRPTSREFGVHLTYVEQPSYKNGRNRNEAALVVENIVHHFHRHGGQSLGVAAFNKRQAEEIELLLDRARSDDPALDRLIVEQHPEEPLFIKNLENVQGDERDVIFISTTYGPEAAGQPIYQRFGPINSDLGWRRLNVIATRAKQRVEVFTSMRPSDVRLGPGARRGVQALRHYLEFAGTGRTTEPGVPTGGDFESEFEEAVADLLGHMGYQCHPQVGVAGFFIDLGVVHPDRPGEYLLGVECDGAAYHSARSVRDRDRLRQEILESKGWSIHRIWSTSWFHTRAAEIDRLKGAIERRLEEDRAVVERLGDFGQEPEILTDAHVVTKDELEKESKVSRESVEDALERYWQKNIRPHYPDRNRSVLSPDAIHYLAAGQPSSRDDWFRTTPMSLRQTINPDELEFLKDVLDVIAEYS